MKTVILSVGVSDRAKEYSLHLGDEEISSAFLEKKGENFEATYEYGGKPEYEPATRAEYEDGISSFLRKAVTKDVLSGITPEIVVIKNPIPADVFWEDSVVDGEYIRNIGLFSEKYPEIVRLVLKEIGDARRIIPEAEMVGVGDFSFHESLGGIPNLETIYHGLLAESILRKLSVFPSGSPKKAIIFYMGDGISVSAVRKGASAYISERFCPYNPDRYESLKYLEDIDFTSISKDDERVAKLFRDIRSEIGSAMAHLGGTDIFVFSGSIAERFPAVRKLILTGMEDLGFILDETENENHFPGTERDIHSRRSPIPIHILKPKEGAELAIKGKRVLGI